MDDSGWMEREQILGDEARSKVPSQFQPQHPMHANPPTLLFPITKMADKILVHQKSVAKFEGLPNAETILPSTFTTTLDSDLITEAEVEKYSRFLTAAFGRLEYNFLWYLKTQNGATPSTFRWRGRTENHSLTSGLDDYPREGVPHDNEHHLDLLCWMATSAKALSTISKALSRPSSTYDEYYRTWLEALDNFHWNENSKSYADLYNHEPSKQFLVHDGYISIYPLLLGLVPHDSPKLVHILEVIQNPNKLWSNYGILSLSRKDVYFGTSENYWRGPIWINMNYLLLASLHNNYIHKEGPHQATCRELYNKLRTNVVDNMFKNYESTGYVWEQYDPASGKGQRSHPFTGWSSLVVLIMAELY